MKAVILAAGLGTRLKPFTDNLPKVMMPLCGKPLLEHQINWLKKFGFEDILINLHYYPEKITDYFGDGKKFGGKITYFYEDPILGTAGAMKNMKKSLDETFLVIYGDVVHRVNLKKLVDFHQEKKAIATLTVGENGRWKDTDLLDLDQDGKIIFWHKRPYLKQPKSKITNLAILVLEPEVIPLIPKKEPPIDFSQEVSPLLVSKKMPIYGYLTDEYNEDIGTVERYHKAQKEFKKFLGKKD